MAEAQEDVDVGEVGMLCERREERSEAVSQPVFMLIN